VEVTFHEKIGAHDVTVVEAAGAFELTEWAEGFLRENGIIKEGSLQKLSLSTGTTQHVASASSSSI